MSDRDRRRQAWLRLRAQRRRAGELRARVVVVSAIAFVLLWGIVFAQMATGNDPVLGNGKQAQPARHRSGSASAAGAAPAAEPEPGSGESGYGESEYGYEPAEEEFVESEPEPAPVITGQS